MEHNQIAIIGAGMAGLTLGRMALAAGMAPALFDKGRKPGGRLATRRLEGLSFNHGCQHFTARDAGFAALTAAHGAALWPAAGDGRFVGTPDMASLAERLAAPLDPRVSTHINSIAFEEGGWTLQAPNLPPARFAALVLAIPPLQAAALLPPAHEFQAALARVHLAPSWTVMLDLGEVAGPDTLRLEEGPLAWIAREASRPGAGPGGGYTLQASARWSTDHLEDPAESVITALTDAFAKATGIDAPPRSAHAHRWRYALADAPLTAPFLWDAAQKLGLCGDWCLAPRLEAAYLSARALGEAMLNVI